MAASATLAASLAGALPAAATETGDGVAQGHNITVFHNIDMVIALGWELGETITVSVQRHGVTIGTASGPAVDPEGEGAGLEVNHGPEGAPSPGDCWSGHTPDILPGDVVRVTNGVETDEVTVDDIRFTGPPAEDPLTGDVVVPVFAKRADGSEFSAAELDSAEFRDGSDLRANTEDDQQYVQVNAIDAANGLFELRYVAPFDFDRNREGASEEQIKQALLTVGAGHAIGFGHTEPPPGDAQLVEGVDDLSGPAAGCQGSPQSQYAVTSVTPDALSLANTDADLTVHGLSQNASTVQVSVTDGAGVAVTEDATLGAANAQGAQTWSATFAAADLATLADGPLLVAGDYTDATSGLGLTGATRTVLKDLEAPQPPSASPRGGTYLGSQSVHVFAAAVGEIRYTLGGSDPTATTGSVYDGPLSITASQTLKMITVDGVGNASPVVTEEYVIQDRLVPGAPSITSATAEPRRATVHWTAPADSTGPAVTDYRVRVFRSGRLVRTVYAGPNATRRTLRRLTNGRRHWFTVQAGNALGYGAVARSSVVVPRGAPSRPRIRRAFAGARGGRDTAIASWRVPVTNGGVRITGYRVTALRLARGGSVEARRSSRMLRPRARSHQMRLAPGRYRFRVRAFNELGRSRLSVRSNRVRSR